MASSTKTFLDDQQSLAALVERMPEPDRSDYKSFKSLQLESAFPSRRMVVYTLKGGRPSDIFVITFGHLMVDWDNGPTFEVSSLSGNVRVSTTPCRLGDRDVFLQVPQNFVLKYKGRQDDSSGVDFVSHYAVLVKTLSKEIHQVDGHTYCVTLNKFRERFPDLNLRY